MDYELFVTPGLGDNSYLIASDGEAVIVDPQRDAWGSSLRLIAQSGVPEWLAHCFPRQRDS
jgi:hypothetical protein